MPSEKTIKLLQFLDANSNKATSVNWDKVVAESPDLNMDKVRARYKIGTQAQVSSPPSEGRSFFEQMATFDPVSTMSGAPEEVKAGQQIMEARRRIYEPVEPTNVGAIGLDIGKSLLRFADPLSQMELASQAGSAPEKVVKGIGHQIRNVVVGGMKGVHPPEGKEVLSDIPGHLMALATPLMLAKGGMSAADFLRSRAKGAPPIVSPETPDLATAKTKFPVSPELTNVRPGVTEPIKPTTDIDLSIEKVTSALKGAKPIRETQEALYTQERGKRLAKIMDVRETTTGEKGFYAELGQLKGEFPKIEFESIRQKISQGDVDNLFNRVKDAGVLTEWEKITAREGLAKMFGEFGGRVPTRGELILLDQVFPPEFMDAVMGKRPLWAKMKEAGLQLANIPRSIMASFDLSFGLRQGAFAAPKFRREFWTSWKGQFKQFGSEKAYQAARDALIADSDFKFAKENKLSFTDVGKIMSQREERFATQWAEKIPLVGVGVRASGRAYTGFANRYRLDIFKSLVGDAEKAGLNPRKNPLLTKAMADFVNNATGRGSLGAFENSALLLNSLFFSPRLNLSRLRLLGPVYYIKQPKFVRQQALKTALAAAGMATTMLTLAKLGGADVTADPRNSDFGKIKIGNTRFDMLAGFGQFIRGGAQIITGQYISSTTGREVDLGEGYRPLTRADILIRMVESKEAPIASFATGLLRNQNWTGEDFNVMKEVGNRFVPMVISDMVELAKDDPKLLGLGGVGLFGVGVQTYKPKYSSTRGGRSSGRGGR